MSRLALLVSLAALTACGRLGVERVGPPPTPGQPLVVLLHGHGTPGDDLVGLAKELSEDRPEASFLVPAGPHRAGLGRTWLPNFRVETREEAITKLEQLIGEASAQVWQRIDEARAGGIECSEVVLAGFSLGGYMAAQVALRAPEGCEPGALVVMSGGGAPPEAPLRAASGRSRMRVLVTHGKRDNVVPPSSGRSIARHFAAAGHPVESLEFDGGHQIAPEVRSALPVFWGGGRVGSPVP